jgi:hypothetical protein
MHLSKSFRQVKLFSDHSHRKRLLNYRNWAMIEGTGGDPFFGDAAANDGRGGRAEARAPAAGAAAGGKGANGAGAGGTRAAGGVASTAEVIEGDERALQANGGDAGGDPATKPERADSGGGDGGSDGVGSSSMSSSMSSGVWAEGRRGSADALLLGDMRAPGVHSGGGREPRVAGGLVVTFRVQDQHKPPAHGKLKSYWWVGRGLRVW